MQKRIGNIIIQTPGGTAAKNANTYKVSLPSSWIKEMGITDNDRKIELCFDGTTISLSKCRSLQAFLEDSKRKNHTLILLHYYDGESLCTKIAANYTEQTVNIENYTSHIIRRAFGNNLNPTWDDFQTFLEERCIPKSRSGLKEYLETIGVDSYEPLEIIKKTQGRMAEDAQWIRIEVVS